MIGTEHGGRSRQLREGSALCGSVRYSRCLAKSTLSSFASLRACPEQREGTVCSGTANGLSMTDSVFVGTCWDGADVMPGRAAPISRNPRTALPFNSRLKRAQKCEQIRIICGVQALVSRDHRRGFPAVIQNRRVQICRSVIVKKSELQRASSIRPDCSTSS